MGINLRALAITIVLALALYFTYGQFSLPWMTALPVIFALSIFALPTPRWFSRFESHASLVVILFFLGLAAISLLPETPPLRTVIVDVANQDYLLWMRALFGLTAIFVIALFVSSSSPQDQKWSLPLFALALLALTAAYALIIPTSPSPQIDVWTLHEQAAEAFAHFQNPYTAEYINIYPKELWPTLTPFGVNYAYLPGVFLWMSPFKALGLDTRYSQVFATLLTSIFLLLIARRVTAKRGFSNYVPALVFMTFPMTTFFLVRGWNDDIGVLFFAIAAYAMCSRRSGLLFVACNAILLLKQYAIFFVPFLIWFSIRNLRKGVFESIFKASLGAICVCAAYTIYDWRNFLGSLYGLHFLKHPDVHQVFPDRRDPYSLMNFMHLYTGLRSSWLFLVVIAAIGLRVIIKNRRVMTESSVLKGLGAMALAMVIFAPVAYANYYEYALGLLLIAFAASADRDGVRDLPLQPSEWEIPGNWWIISFITVRSFILFLTNWLIVETRPASAIADLTKTGRIPFADFNIQQSPFNLIPDLLAGWLQKFGDNQDFIAYHTLFQLIVCVFDIGLATVIFRRFKRNEVSKTSLAFYIFGPLLLGPLFYASPALVSVAMLIFICAALKNLGQVQRLVQWAHTYRKTAFQVSILVLTALIVTVAILWQQDFELNIDPVLFPTYLLIWILILSPFAGLGSSRKAVPVLTWSLVFLFTLTLAATTVVLFNIETIIGPESVLSNFVWIRNSLLGLSAIIGVWVFYRSRIAGREV